MIMLRLKVFLFVKDCNVPTLPAERESNPESIEKLERFTEKVTQNKMCDFWSNEDELTSKVTAALFKTFTLTPQIGWIRANTIDTTKTLEELTKLSAENRKLKEENTALINAKQDDENKHYSVQPWFHVTSISRMGGKCSK